MRCEIYCSCVCMSNFVPEKVFLRGVFFYYFYMKKTSAEGHRVLVLLYAENVLAKWRFWFGRRRTSWAAKGFADEELVALI